ncbi:MAG: hypothetical protein J6W08_02995 [Alphaproteobacteria bacterium]|nr:hypothetical protein [Alphaproteobacteria bacterium]
MAEVIVCKKHLCKRNLMAQRGASMTEVILAVSVIVAVSPFMYNQITNMANDAQDIAKANQIVKSRDGIINFLRVNQSQWGDDAEIQMSEEEIKAVVPMAHTGFIDKYKINGATITEAYIAFSLDEPNFRVANIAKHIGEDAAVVREDGVAYAPGWAVSAPENFHVGDLIYRISRDFEGADNSKFLHRGTMGEDDLNKMQRDLHMNNFNIFNVSDIDALSAKIVDVDAVFLDATVVDTNSLYFSSGANLNSTNVAVGSMRVTGDTSGFKLISADKLNGDKYTTNGRIITDRATIGNSVNVAGNLVIKSTSSTTSSGFGGISMNKLLTPYISATDMAFFENYGITVSGELLLTDKAPLKIGSWVFPSTTPPSFSKFILTRATLPTTPDADEFKKITHKDWQTR